MRWHGMAALVAVVVLVAVLGQTSVGHAMLQKAGLDAEPTSYTALAFQHPQALPEQLASRRASVGVSFVIHNAGSTPRDYQWSVVLVQGQRTRRVASGSARVASGRGATITQAVSISCTRGQVRIVVSLVRPAESIDAWTACFSPRS